VDWETWPCGTDQRFMLDIMLYTVAILVVMVQLIQVLGDLVVKHLSRHR